MQATKTKKVLVIEDEALVGIMMEDFLGDFGYSVVGPIENMQAAVFLAATEQIDVAVVDINISGQIASAVADKLIERENSIPICERLRENAWRPLCVNSITP